MRYILATRDMSPGDPYSEKKQLELGQEDNRFYNCIEFYYEDPIRSIGCHNKVNDPGLLQDLMDMDYDALYNYVIDN